MAGPQGQTNLANIAHKDIPAQLTRREVVISVIYLLASHLHHYTSTKTDINSRTSNQWMCLLIHQIST